MTDDELVAAITRAWRSLDPADSYAMAAEAMRITREGGGGTRQVGWLNPRTGTLHRMKVDLAVSPGWVPVHVET